MFRDSDVEVDLVWYPCNDDAPVLPIPSAICSLDWGRQESFLGIYAGNKVGEVPGAPRVYNGLKAKPAATGLHRCGTDRDFAEGAKFDPTVNRPKRADGLPVCCGDLPAGVVVGGRALPFVPRGVVIGGSAAGIISGGAFCSVAPAWNPVTQGSAVFVDNALASNSLWVNIVGLVAGNTYTFRMDTTVSTADAQVFGGLNCTTGITYNQTAGPGSSSYTFTQTIPPLTPNTFVRLHVPSLFAPSYLLSVT